MKHVQSFHVETHVSGHHAAYGGMTDAMLEYECLSDKFRSIVFLCRLNFYEPTDAFGGVFGSGTGNAGTTGGYS
jgi:hypothetical protein